PTKKAGPKGPACGVDRKGYCFFEGVASSSSARFFLAEAAAAAPPRGVCSRVNFGATRSMAPAESLPAMVHRALKISGLMSLVMNRAEPSAIRAQTPCLPLNTGELKPPLRPTSVPASLVPRTVDPPPAIQGP